MEVQYLVFYSSHAGVYMRNITAVCSPLIVWLTVCFFSFSVTVGKTSLITRFMYDSFDNTYQVSQYEHILQLHNLSTL